MLIAYSRRKSD
ncbi:hypothetical protein B4U79_02593 [Dinothrombium tinctorium]|uniref:Uncharacterized protein n=1 Tax=Dinothrombium tinctorium TaxID=1965070 RepID=A0A3S3PX81_9ACAR|nr:hypothetical protein B4U79_02593 [Dinothrombium tinctorium]